MKSLAYLCFQAVQEGQASYAHVHEIIQGLQKRGWQVFLYAPAYRQPGKKLGLTRRLFKFLALQLRFIFTISKYDIVYIRMHYVILPSVVTAKIFKRPVVIEVNGQDEDLYIVWPSMRKMSYFVKWFLFKSFKMASAIVTVTPKLKDWVIQQTGNKQVYVIPNAANSTLFNPKAKTIIKHEENYVIFVGTLSKWQGIDVILQAIGDPRWPLDLKLIIAGDGQERTAIEEEAAKNSLVHYLGIVPYNEIPGLIASSKVSISPQNNEGGRSDTGLYPLKVFESLACGVPVIVTDFPGQADLVRENKCGLVIPHNNPEALIEAVKYILDNREERDIMGKNGRKLIEREHNWDKRAGDTDKILNNLIHSNTAGK